MRTSIVRRLASWAGALSLGLGAAAASAQSGQPPTGPPVTNPNTNRQAPGAEPAPKTTAEVLPGVPATRRDPAPPGTRPVRVDEPPAGANPGDRGAGRPASKGILTAEGVVTRLDRAGKEINGELVRFAFDPSQDWFAYVNSGASNVPERDAARPKTTEEQKAANVEQHGEASSEPKVMEMAITKRTYCSAFARSAEGVDLYGTATASTPDVAARAPNAAPGAARVDRPQETNFTNIREGSFVAVRYRKAGDVNEVLNVTLIERPLNPDADKASTPPAGGTPAAPGRTSTVPATPVGAALPK